MTFTIRDCMQISSLWNIEKEFRTKVSLLAITFGSLMGSQVLWRSLKGSIFAKIIGAAYVPDAKIVSILVLVPLILIYSRLVDVLRRHQLVYAFTIFHAIGGLIFAGLLAHPTLGIANTTPSPHRWLGWFFYLFMESFSAFLSTTFWSFANSVNKPKDAKRYYGLFVAGSKIGGIVVSGLFWVILTVATDTGSSLTAWLRPGGGAIGDHIILPIILAVGSLLLLAAALCIYLLKNLVPGYHMHGYEAVYQLEKQRAKEEIREEKQEEKLPFSFRRSLSNAWEIVSGSLDGLRVILTHSYVLGIFCLALFHDMIMTIFDFRVLMSANAAYETVGQLVLFYLSYFFIMNVVGLAISLFGTTPIQRMLGNRAALLIYPTLCVILVVATFFSPTPYTYWVAIVLLRAFNYGLNHPIREVLYIPTTKEIKFKAKAWTDAFGTRIAKGSSSFLYKGTLRLAPHAGFLVCSGFTFAITCIWVVVSYFLGRTLQDALDKKEVIGKEETA